MRKAFPIIPLVLLCLLFTACGDFFVSQNALDHITLTSTSLYLSSGGTPESKQISATGVRVDGSTYDLTNGVSWKSSNTAIATVDGGKVTAVSAGTATITAAQGSVTSTMNVVVGTGTLQTIAVSPSTFTLGPTTAKTQQLQVTATLSDGSTLSNLSSIVSWTSSATQYATVDQNGLVTFVAAPTTSLTTTVTITASVATASSTVSGTSTGTVQQI